MKGVKAKYLLVLSFALVLVASASYGIAAVLSGGANPTSAQTPSPEPPPSIAQLDAFRARFAEQKRQDDAKPRFTGRLGDFEIVAQEADAGPDRLCSSGPRAPLPEGSRNFLPSELNKPNQTEQTACADGMVVAAYSLTTGRRSYFRGAPRVHAIAPADRLSLVDVDGYRALVVRPPVDLGMYFGYAIKRAETASQPGILVAVWGGGSLAETQQRLRQALSE